jgi:hypothetical protein
MKSSSVRHDDEQRVANRPSGNPSYGLLITPTILGIVGSIDVGNGDDRDDDFESPFVSVVVDDDDVTAVGEVADVDGVAIDFVGPSCINRRSMVNAAN